MRNFWISMLGIVALAATFIGFASGMFEPKYVEIEVGCSQPDHTNVSAVSILQVPEPVVMITQVKDVVRSQWVTITNEQGEMAILTYSDLASEGDPTPLIGSTYDIADGVGFDLLPGEKYVIEVIVQPKDNGYPSRFDPENVVQTIIFTIKPCP